MPPPPPRSSGSPERPPPPPKQRAEATFNSALERPTAEREAFIAQKCADDTVLLGEVRELLAAHEGAGGFMKTDAPRSPEIEAELARRKPEAEGERIGRYKLLQEIGEGGFGTVWMAEQVEPVTRRVALKIIKLGMDTREVIARFEAERQALAMMDHPNIAKVLDAGATDRGRPFFVMELVKGMPITQYCDEVGLGTRERLALFGDVCSAIQHAHQKGVIHRDIKPSNVMVTLHGDKPVVKVIDFGIAKATQGKLTDKTLFTRFEQFIGTPVYMSPEQASLSGLDIDTRSDIYALGILLYELLVGKPPFDGKSLVSAGYEEMRRIIREVEPVKPSSRISTMAGEERTQFAKARHVEPEKLHRLVEPDLDWIVMKAIEKDRARRYETASAFAQDIARFLADETVSATPPSAAYKFRKFARRNKATLWFSAFAFVVMALFSGVSTYQAVRARRAEKVTAEMLVQVIMERDAKELARKDAEDISKFLGKVFESPDPARDGRTITVAETLDIAARKLDTDLATQPGHRAKLQTTLARTYFALGLKDQAIRLQENARDFHLNNCGAESDCTLVAMKNLAVYYFASGRREEALQLGKQVLALRRTALGPEHPDTIEAMHNLAAFYLESQRPDEAIPMQETVLAVRRKTLGAEHPETLSAMHNLAGSYFRSARRDEAIRTEEEVLGLYRKILGQEHPDTLRALNNLAAFYNDAGHPDKALQLQEEILPLRSKIMGPEHPDTLNAMFNLASSYDDTGHRKEALELREKVLALFRKVLGPEHPNTLAAMHNLANSYNHSDRQAEAIHLQEEALALSRKVLGQEHPGTLDALSNLASFYWEGGRRDEALKAREEVLAVSQQKLGQEHPATLAAMNNLAASYGEAGRMGEALPLQERTLKLRRKVLGAEHPDTISATDNLALAYSVSGRRADATKLLNELLMQSRKSLGPEHPDTLALMEKFAEAFWKAGWAAESLPLDEEALKLRQKVNGPHAPDALAVMTRLARSYAELGRTEDARKLREETQAVRAALKLPPEAEPVRIPTTDNRRRIRVIRDPK